jgi:hypothetical protein
MSKFKCSPLSYKIDLAVQAKLVPQYFEFPAKKEKEERCG